MRLLRSKTWLFMLIAIVSLSVLTACGGNTTTKQDTSGEMRTYQSEKGAIQVPKHPKRVAMMAATYAGNLLELGITPIAINEWPKKSKFYEGKLDQVEVVTEDNPEKLVGLNPDLIITFSDDKNIKKYQEIAPTVTLTYDKYDYLEQHIEIGKIVGKEKEARDWVAKWNQKTAEAKQKVQDAIGKDKTVMVIETFGKDLYVYGKNWGRGTEILYQALELKAPEKLQKDVFGPGYKAISTEVIPQYAGDYIFVGEGSSTKNSFMESDVWKQLPAVKNNQVIKFDSDSFYFNDPISLEKELDFIVEQLTKNK